MTAGPFVGIDLGAQAVQAVSLDESGNLADAKLFAADEGDDVADWAALAKVIAIDAPDRPSSGAHAGDERLPPKFQRGRCAEEQQRWDARTTLPWREAAAARSAALVGRRALQGIALGALAL